MPKKSYVRARNGSGRQSSARRCPPCCLTIGRKFSPSARAGSMKAAIRALRWAEVLKILRQIIATEPPARPSEGVIRTKDGRERLWSFVKSPLGALLDGRRVFVTVAQDLTERKAHEEHVEILMREINHRAKNMLSLVLAIARQTVAREPEEFIQRLTDRIQALAANQDLLVRNEWQRVDMEDLVRAQLAHLADLVRSRIEVFGPKLRLNAAAAQAI